MTPFKSIPQNGHHDLKKKYSYLGKGAFVSKPVTDILAKKAVLCE